MLKLNRIVMTHVALLLVAGLCQRVGAQEWGNLKGVLVYDGAAPAPKPLDIKKDIAFCGKHKLVDETLVVDPKSKGIRNIAIQVYVNPRRGFKNPPVHPSYEATARSKIRMTNKNCRFEPRVCALRTSQTLLMANDDEIGHNMKGSGIYNNFNILIPAGGDVDQKVPKPELVALKMDCNIHDWMTGWVIVKDHPYVVITDEQGRFELKNLPAGELTMQAWHELAGFVDDVDHNGKSWKYGRFKVKILPGKTVDLGTVKVLPKAFEE